MLAPSAAVLLDAWEQGLALPLPRRPLALLTAVYPENPVEQLANQSVGRNDALLLALREALFGAQLHGVSACPHCAEKIEMNFSVDDLRVATSDEQASGVFHLCTREHELQFRLPTTLDLEAAAATPDVEAARQMLLSRCVLSASTPAGTVAPTALPDPVLAVVSEAMSHADPQAAAEIALTCPACAQTWTTAFDIGAFLWAEVHAWAQHQLRDIHALATAYGWNEKEVLALSPARRRAYLDLAQS